MPRGHVGTNMRCMHKRATLICVEVTLLNTVRPSPVTNTLVWFKNFIQFLPRDAAMLARFWEWKFCLPVRPSVCLSVCNMRAL